MTKPHGLTGKPGNNPLGRPKGTGKPASEIYKSLNIRLPADMLELSKLAAGRSGIKHSEWVRNQIQKGIISLSR